MKTTALVILSLSAASAAAFAPAVCFADNPIIQTKFTADPAPMVFNDTLYLYTSHDEDDAQGFTMYNWLLYSTTDMANWTVRARSPSALGSPRVEAAGTSSCTWTLWPERPWEPWRS